LEEKHDVAKRRGFSLTEMLIVVLIIGILVGVVGSLMGGFVTSFEMTDDQTIARRRAQDVFNILQTPILNAGLGIPANRFADYFSTAKDNFGGAPIQNWTEGPIQVISHNTSQDRGNALRVVYSVFSGVKNVSDTDILNFSSSAVDGIGKNPSPTELTLSGNVTIVPTIMTGGPAWGGEGIQLAGANTNTMHSYITFPGISMHPEIVTGTNNATPPKLQVHGKTPHAVSDDDVLPRNVIRAYHDMFFVRAALAYVDNDGTFCLYDINNYDPSNGVPPMKLPTVSDVDTNNAAPVYRVEGIKAVRFEPVTSAGKVTGVNVYVLAEGDNSVTGRRSDTPAVLAVRSSWPGITWEDDMYYEDFEMRWRTRNIEAPMP
jgi:prepilin-type N-terminal cleavage/methylation domain-containing protein